MNKWQQGHQTRFKTKIIFHSFMQQHCGCLVIACYNQGMLDARMCMLMEHVEHFVEMMDGFNFLALVEYFRS
jgi:hypothetical protein